MAVKIQNRRDTAANWTTTNPTLSSGEIGVETDTLKVKVGNGTTAWTSLSYMNSAATAVDQLKSISIPSPTTSDIYTLLYTKSSMTLTKIQSVLRGSSTPSASYTIKYASDRSSSTPTVVVTGGITVTSTTTGSSITSFNNGTIPAGNFVWIEVTAVSGTVDELNVNLIF
jgi:hypothetical protein